jgi:putative iron-dependent peroxidase
VNLDNESRAAVRGLCGELPKLLRAVGFREPAGNLSCLIGFGSEAWDWLFGQPRPSELHPFREIQADTRRALATPGDLLFHIRAEREDLCFELATQIMLKLGNAVDAKDEVHGFRYFDARDLLGFVDGTENPADQEAIDAVQIGDEDPAFAGGSYVIVQKYLHDLNGWNALPVDVQEGIIGRTKLSDVELDEKIKPSSAHNALTTLVENGQEIKILRQNMAFGRAGHGEYGTYFIGYARSPRPIERMLENISLVGPRPTTIACSISAGQSRAICFLSRLNHFSIALRLTVSRLELLLARAKVIHLLKPRRPATVRLALAR